MNVYSGPERVERRCGFQCISEADRVRCEHREFGVLIPVRKYDQIVTLIIQSIVGDLGDAFDRSVG